MVGTSIWKQVNQQQEHNSMNYRRFYGIFLICFFISKEELSGVTSTSQLLTIKQKGEYFG